LSQEELVMATAASVLPLHWTAADLHDHLGHIPLQRIRLYPPPGTASLADVLTVQAQEDRLCELVDGVLVEKTVGYYESRVALLIGHFLEDYLEQHDLGIVLGADGMLQLLHEQVRIPDVSFFSWAHFPNRELPSEPIPRLVPDLAVEVLSASNTPQEMRRKLQEYFAAGTHLVWYVDPEAQRVLVYTALEQWVELGIENALDGGDVLPGLELPIRKLFARTGRRRLEGSA
jgi:Uma2 family endonuclease